jgi:ElaB/YqjD/DUF883 family membrane-anchored ribosome-binding protein
MINVQFHPNGNFKETAMINRAVDAFDLAKGRMAGDFRTMINDSEDLLKAAASVSGEGFALARTKFEERLKRAKATLADASQPVLERARETAAVTNEYVHGNPWTAVGIAVAAGVLIGFVAALGKKPRGHGLLD